MITLDFNDEFFDKPYLEFDAYLLNRNGQYNAARLRDMDLWINLMVTDPILQLRIQQAMEQAVLIQAMSYPAREYIKISKLDCLGEG